LATTTAAPFRTPRPSNRAGDDRVHATLELEVERRGERPAGAAAVDAAGPPEREDRVHEARGLVGPWNHGADGGHLGHGAEAGLLFDASERGHPGEHVIAALERAPEVAARLRHARRLGDASDERCLGDVERGGVSPEILLRGPRHALDAIAEGHAVQVLLEDLLFREDPLQRRRAGDLEQLGERPQRAPVDALHELLGDRGRAAPPAPGPQVVDERARRRQEVDAMVLEEARVLGGQEGVDDVRGDVPELDPAAIRAVDPRLTEHRAVAVGDREGVARAGEARLIDPERRRGEAEEDHRGEGQPGRDRDGGRERAGDPPPARPDGRFFRRALHGSTVIVEVALRALKRGA
jgi:hypothetical protein